MKKTVQFDRFLLLLFCFCFIFEDGSHFTAQTDFQLVIFQLQSPKGLYYAWFNLKFLKAGSLRMSVQLWKNMIGQMECEAEAMNWGTQPDQYLSQLWRCGFFPLNTGRALHV